MKMDDDLIHKPCLCHGHRACDQIDGCCKNAIQTGTRVDLIPKLSVLRCQRQQIARLAGIRGLPDGNGRENQPSYYADGLQQRKPVPTQPRNDCAHLGFIPQVTSFLERLRLQRCRNVRASQHERFTRHADNPLPGAAARASQKAVPRFVCNIRADYGKVARFHFEDVRAMTAGGAQRTAFPII